MVLLEKEEVFMNELIYFNVDCRCRYLEEYQAEFAPYQILVPHFHLT